MRLFVIAVLVLLTAPASGQTQQTLSLGYSTSLDTLRQGDSAVDSLIRGGELALASRQTDRTLPDRVHEYFVQYFAGVPVLGGGVSRQLDRGVTVSLSGTVHRNIGVSTAPLLSAAEAVVFVERALGAAVVTAPGLVILPLPGGSYALAYRVATSNLQFVYADAVAGRILRTEDARRAQEPTVGTGTGVRGDRKKVSTTHVGDQYEARDRSRPGEVVTLDARYSEAALVRLMTSHVLGTGSWLPSDIAVDDDNTWSDKAVVDNHAHIGWTYDFYSQAVGWNGLDGRNGRILGIVNISRDFPNAFFAPPPFGPEGTGAIVFGEFEGEPMVALDVVAHELTHGVIHYAVSSRTGSDLIDNLQVAVRLGPASFVDQAGMTHECATRRFETFDENFEPVMAPAVCINGRFVLGASQAGAIHEAYSDIMAEAAAFFHRDNAGTESDFLQGSDDEPIGVIRSLRDPRSLNHPAAYGDRVEFALIDTVFGWDFSGAVFVDGQYFGSIGPGGYDGSHWNSLILSHAYYLAIEGGTNASTGSTVAGAGVANRLQVERIFFRALADLMPAVTSLPQAADAIRQSAADLASGTAVQRAVEDALRAVGLPAGTTIRPNDSVRYSGDQQ